MEGFCSCHSTPASGVGGAGGVPDRLAPLTTFLCVVTTQNELHGRTQRLQTRLLRGIREIRRCSFHSGADYGFTHTKIRTHFFSSRPSRMKVVILLLFELLSLVPASRTGISFDFDKDDAIVPLLATMDPWLSEVAGTHNNEASLAARVTVRGR